MGVENANAPSVENPLNSQARVADLRDGQSTVTLLDRAPGSPLSQVVASAASIGGQVEIEDSDFNNVFQSAQDPASQDAETRVIVNTSPLARPNPNSNIFNPPTLVPSGDTPLSLGLTLGRFGSTSGVNHVVDGGLHSIASIFGVLAAFDSFDFSSTTEGKGVAIGRGLQNATSLAAAVATAVADGEDEQLRKIARILNTTSEALRQAVNTTAIAINGGNIDDPSALQVTRTALSGTATTLLLLANIAVLTRELGDGDGKGIGNPRDYVDAALAFLHTSQATSALEEIFDPDLESDASSYLTAAGRLTQAFGRVSRAANLGQKTVETEVDGETVLVKQDGKVPGIAINAGQAVVDFGRAADGNLETPERAAFALAGAFYALEAAGALPGKLSPTDGDAIRFAGEALADDNVPDIAAPAGLILYTAARLIDPEEKLVKIAMDDSGLRDSSDRAITAEVNLNPIFFRGEQKKDVDPLVAGIDGEGRPVSLTTVDGDLVASVKTPRDPEELDFVETQQFGLDGKQSTVQRYEETHRVVLAENVGKVDDVAYDENGSFTVATTKAGLLLATRNPDGTYGDVQTLLSKDELKSARGALSDQAFASLTDGFALGLIDRSSLTAILSAPDPSLAVLETVQPQVAAAQQDNVTQ